MAFDYNSFRQQNAAGVQAAQGAKPPTTGLMPTGYGGSSGGAPVRQPVNNAQPYTPPQPSEGPGSNIPGLPVTGTPGTGSGTPGNVQGQVQGQGGGGNAYAYVPPQPVTGQPPRPPAPIVTTPPPPPPAASAYQSSFAPPNPAYNQRPPTLGPPPIFSAQPQAAGTPTPPPSPTPTPTPGGGKEKPPQDKGQDTRNWWQKLIGGDRNVPSWGSGISRGATGVDADGNEIKQ